jgi:solute carrier family 35 (adenosine 3'-phospho 5'-phosphosulfate transporter), member B2
MLSGTLILIVLLLASVALSISNNGIVRGEKINDEETFVSCQDTFLKIFIDVSKQLTHEAGVFVNSIHLNNKVKLKTKGKLDDSNLKGGIMDNPITNADKLSNYILLYGFNIMFPKLNIVSEEKLVIPNEDKLMMGELLALKLRIKQYANKKLLSLNKVLNKCMDRNNRVTTTFDFSEYTMWLDPLDATKEYSEHDKKLVKYVSIMSCMGYKGKPVGGLIYFPFTTKTYWAYRESNSKDSKIHTWKNTFQDIPKKFHINNINKDTKLIDGKQKRIIDLIYSRSHDGGVVGDVNKRTGFHVDKSIKAAGSGYKMTQVALNGIDPAKESNGLDKINQLVYAHNTKIKKWDVCAGDAILKSMNGITMDWGGDEIDYSYESPKIIDKGLIAVKYNANMLKKYLDSKEENFKEINFTIFQQFMLNIAFFAMVMLLSKNKHSIRMCLMSLYRNDKNIDSSLRGVDRQSNTKSNSKSRIYKIINDAMQFLLHGTKTSEDEINRLGEKLDIIKRDIENGNNTKRPITTTNYDNKYNDKSESASINSTNQYVRSLLFSAVGLQACYLLWGICQENIMSQEFQHTVHLNESHYFKHSQFIVFANRLFAFTAAFCLHMYQTKRGGNSNDKSRSSPWPPFYLFSFSSLSNSLSSYCQYEALKYLSFPFHVVFKSSKLIPVMIMGYIINKKVYKRVEYVASIFISFGIYIFSQGGGQGKNKSKKPHNSKVDALSLTLSPSPTIEQVESNLELVNIGIFLMILYITFDAFTSNWQSRLFKKYKVNKLQIMIGINFWSALLIFTSISISGEMHDAIKFFQTHHVAAFYSLVVLCISGTLGQFFIYHTIKTFGPLIFSIIMATRQIFSIVLSCIIFQHTLNIYSVIGSVIVFLSIGMRIYYK